MSNYFLDHGTIHCRATGKHVSIAEAVDLLNIESGVTERIAWGVTSEVGKLLREAELKLGRVETMCRDLIAVAKMEMDRVGQAGAHADVTKARVAEDILAAIGAKT